MRVPTDLKDTIILILSDNLKDMSEVEKFKKCPEDDLISYHHGLGTDIRNHYKLWEDKEIEKYVDMSEEVDFMFCHPDDISFEFIKEAQRQLKNVE